MKKIFALAIALVAAPAMAAISDSGHPHNLHAGNPGTSVATSACQYCHLPHRATAITGAPLWAKTMNTATPYGTTIGGQTATTVSPISLACLTCHDGTTNIGVVHGATVDRSLLGAADRKIAPGALIDANLGNDHPVSIPYVVTPANLAGLVAITSLPTTNPFVFFGTTQTIECGTCHDPHGKWDGTAVTAKLLRGGAGDFCTKCHQK